MRGVWMLLGEEDVDRNRVNTVPGQRPLLRAAKIGNEGILKVLMERKDIPAAIPDTTN